MLLLQLAAGLVILPVGGELLVRGAVAVARRSGLPPLLIGLTLVGFGTSTPELVTSIHAALVGAPGIATGNVVGSNIVNILLVLGIAVVIAPFACDRRAFQRDGAVLILVSLACLAAVLAGTIGRGWGTVLALGLVVYLFGTYRLESRKRDASARLHASEAELAEPVPHSMAVALLFALAGIVLTILGARLLVEGAVNIAEVMGISKTLVGLTIVALGTSLPELAISVVAAARRHTDVAFGNVIGSNIYNILGILGITALVHPLDVPAEIARLDIWVMMGVTILLVLFTVSGWRLTRLEGIVLMAGYGLYMGVLADGAGAF